MGPLLVFLIFSLVSSSPIFTKREVNKAILVRSFNVTGQTTSGNVYVSCMTPGVNESSDKTDLNIHLTEGMIHLIEFTLGSPCPSGSSLHVWYGATSNTAIDITNSIKNKVGTPFDGSQTHGTFSI
jgi:hypothetical protein